MDHKLRLEPDGAEDRVGEDEDGDSVRFIGNATVLLRIGGFTVLTDPTFVHRHEKVPLGWGLTTTRLTDPAMDVADLPPLDFVLLSHFHGDHFDQAAQRDLDRELPIVTTPQAQGDLAERGFHRTTGLGTWDRVEVAKGDSRLRVTACPGRHGPGVTDLLLPDVMGSVIEYEARPGRTRRLYISGDTLVFDGLREIPERFPEIETGLLHLGGTRVMGIMVTMDAEQGVEAARIIDPGTVIPIHYDDYDVFTSPLADFVEAAAAAGIGDRVRTLERGETHRLP
ncbi:MBL fold metallo-hydrolase [Glycomyces sp. A-F 0318]|uniref:MBL fold metallo-hydrolase n=1 Tax=Glycomyces amatae TaxID=2881355 RepID=UPI001E4968E3|nr:MBL fold metallo-hydrolase [Glycomyces amatae]MCD0445055.1 MBL fold metallo-hydrolase [Glycomyces amatae]